MRRIRTEFIETHLLSALYHAEERVCFESVREELNECLRQLGETLDEGQKEALFQVYDLSDTLRGMEAERRYEQGFRRGMQLMTECLYFEE